MLWLENVIFYFGIDKVDEDFIHSPSYYSVYISQQLIHPVVYVINDFNKRNTCFVSLFVIVPVKCGAVCLSAICDFGIS